MSNRKKSDILPEDDDRVVSKKPKKPHGKAVEKSQAATRAKTNKVLAPETEKEEATPAEIADACEDVLNEDVCAEIAARDPEEVIDFAFTALIASGVEDPEAYLREKGILE